MSENTYKCTISKVPILIHLIYVALAFLVPVFILYFVFVRIGEVMAEEFFSSVISNYKASARKLSPVKVMDELS